MTQIYKLNSSFPVRLGIQERDRGREREGGKAFRNWLGKRISQSTRLDSPRTLKSSQKLNFKPIVASPEPAPAAAPTVGLWPHLGMCIASSPVELRHLHQMPNRAGESEGSPLIEMLRMLFLLVTWSTSRRIRGSRGCHKGV